MSAEQYQVPIHVLMPFTHTTVRELTGPSSPKILEPLRELRLPIDPLVRELDEALDALVEMDRDQEQAKVEVRGEQEATSEILPKAIDFLRYVDAVAEGGGDARVLRKLAWLGDRHEIHDEAAYHTVVYVLGVVVDYLEDHEAELAPFGLDARVGLQGARLLGALLGGRSRTADTTVDRQALTVQVYDASERVRTLLLRYEHMRLAASIHYGRELHGFDRGVLDQWRATRPSRRAAPEPTDALPPMTLGDGDPIPRWP